MPETTPVYDGDSMELPSRVAQTAAKWLMWKHRMTEAQAADLLKNLPRGPTRQRQRAEAIDVADFVETLNHV